VIVAHLTASTFFGGPERQMLGLAGALTPRVRSLIFSFREGGRCQAFLNAAHDAGIHAQALRNDTPWLRAAVREMAGLLAEFDVNVLCCHGYKADLVGCLAAQRCGIPVVGVSRGWTAENFKVRVYEWLDKRFLRWMNRVVCVSDGQAEKVRRAGVEPSRVAVIRNAIDVNRFASPDRGCLCELHDHFPTPRRVIIASAGRLSPEKGFDVLLEAAARVVAQDDSAGFIHFGDGPQRERMLKRIAALGLQHSFVLAGMRNDLDRLYPFFDLLVLPSHTEGLPNVVLEAFAARVPVVATAVGGTPEVVEDGINGHLVPPADPERLAARILNMLRDDERRLTMGEQGYRRVCDDFTFAAQARAYERLFAELTPSSFPGVKGRIVTTEESLAR
jgi:glycosyltransferase involved in cell wall biosynthesis